MRLLGYNLCDHCDNTSFFGGIFLFFAGGYGCIEANGRERPQRHGGTDGRWKCATFLLFAVLCLLLSTMLAWQHISISAEKVNMIVSHFPLKRTLVHLLSSSNLGL
jgi:hypothetical protein